MKSRLAPFLFLLPALLATGALVLWPLAQTVFYSLTNYNPAITQSLTTGLHIERNEQTGELSLVVDQDSPAARAGITPETVFDGLIVPADPRQSGSRERLERFRGDPARRLGAMRRSLERAEAAARAYPARERRLTLFVAEDSASREVTLRFEPVPVRRIPPPDLGLSAALVSGEWKLVVTPGSVAARAGITDSDAVVSLQGSRLDSMSEFNQRLAEVLRITQPRGPVPVVGPFTVALAVRDTTQASPETRAILLPGTRGAFTLDPPPATNRTDLAFVGLWNYWRILVPSPFSNEARDFYHYLMQTIVWTVTNVALHFVLGLGLALLLNQRIRGRVIYRVVLLLPWAVPVFVSAFAWRFLFNQQGIINQALGWVGIAPIPWLSSAVWTMVAVIVTNVWLGVPFMMVVLLGGLQSIPEEMYEAARVDGANRWQQFWNVTLPLLRPVAVTATLLGVIWTFNMFNVIYLVQGREGRQVEILATLAFRRFYVNQDYGLAAAYGVIILLMLLVFALFYNRALRGTERVWQ